MYGRREVGIVWLDARLGTNQGQSTAMSAEGPPVWEGMGDLGNRQKLLEGPIGGMLSQQVGKFTLKAVSCSRSPRTGQESCHDVVPVVTPAGVSQDTNVLSHVRNKGPGGDLVPGWGLDRGSRHHTM